MSTCVILNPAAGSVDDVETMREKLRPLQPSRVIVSKESGDAERAAEEAVKAGCDLVISAGGDGTLNEVVNGLAKANCAARLAILPLGTGNDFARNLKMEEDIDRAVVQIQAGRMREIDLVRVSSDQVRYFINVSSGGFSGLVDEKLTPEVKKSWGPLAYLRCAAAAFPDLRAYKTTVLLDGKERIETELYNVVVANGRYVANGIPVAPQAEIGDGLLDVVLVEKRSTPELALLAAQILLGNHLTSEGVIFKQARRVEIDSKPGMWFNADGELIGNEPATFDLLPRAVQCITGADGA